ncbi:Cupredoxin, partial [Thozetella sp. PMI_491]
LAFDPEFVEANPGDVLEFHFLPHNHSVVMGDFDRPCKAAKSGGFYSGFFALMSGEADQVFRVTVNDSKPFVFYCSQDVPGHQHCQAGMVGVINSDNSTLSKYKEAAQTADSADSPATAFGGTFMASSPSSSTSSAATTTSAASTT